MAKCVIFCAAEFSRLLAPLAAEDYVIAADGGLLHTKKLGISPDLIIGDFDSLGYTPRESQVFPVEKDDTDAMLAVRRGLKLGYREFLLYGSVDGPRLDHTVANFQTLEYLCRHGATGYLVGTNCIVTVLHPGELVFPAGTAGHFSAFSLGDAATGVSLRGLHYPLEDGRLDCGFPLGVSNHFTGAQAHIRLKSGSLLLIWDRENGLPRERRSYADL